MDARQARILVASVFVSSLLVVTLSTPASAADCLLSAPAYVNVGTPLTILGTGFPASSSVDIALSVQGGGSDAFSVQSDPNGALQISSTPEDIDIGVTTVEATAGTVCAAQVTYTVLAAGATPPPAATSEPADTSGTSAAPNAPRTDATDVETATSSGFAGVRILALALIVVGGASLLLTRSTRRR